MSPILIRVRDFLLGRAYALVDAPTAAEGLNALRERLAGALLWFGALVGVIILPLTLFMALSPGLLGFLVLDLVALVGFTLAYLVSFPRRPRRTVLVVAAAFGLGASLLVSGGSFWAGSGWLFAAIVLGALFFEMRGAIALALLELLVYALLAYSPLAHLLHRAELAHANFLAGLGLVAIALVVALAVTNVVTALREALAARIELANELASQELILEREARDRRCAEDLLEYYRDYDRLTGLPNRESFGRSLTAAIRQAERRGRYLAILSLGIDRLKRVNEAHGHQAGDSVMIQAAAALRSSFRDDDLIARFGEDRFAVLCADVKSPEDVKDLIAKARGALGGRLAEKGAGERISASIGLALFPNDGREPASLLRAAETALRLAEESGPGSYRLFDPRLQEELVVRLRLEAELGAAVKGGAFEPWFQPKVDRLGRVVGAEALARWPLPDGSVRGPDSFVSAAERSGDIAGLGRIILGKACERAAAWELEGLPPIPISVNLSPYQFRSPDLVGDIRAALADSGLSPYRLELEVTETGLAGDEDGAVDLLASLKALGISISIDDFGTGYSSIAKLRDYPVDTVKLPRELVEPVPLDPRATTIAEAIIDLAHNLHFEVVAEGVETHDQLTWLRGKACDLYQGFLFSPPLPVPAFRATLARGFAGVVE